MGSLTLMGVGPGGAGGATSGTDILTESSLNLEAESGTPLLT